MARTLSKSTIEQVANSSDIVVDLVKTCLKVKLPMSYAAAMLGVSRMTLHSWMRGGPMRYGRDVRIQAFIDLIEEDVANGELPKKDLKETRMYAEKFAGRTITKAG